MFTQTAQLIALGIGSILLGVSTNSYLIGFATYFIGWALMHYHKE